jgi:hypothetical protein
MSFKPKTSAEINLHRIKTILKKIERNEISVQGCGLNKWLERLKIENELDYEEMNAKYISLAKDNSMSY